MNTEEFINYIDESYGSIAPQELASEDLAEPLEYTYEITVNFPQKKLTTFEHIECYKDIWQNLMFDYKVSRSEMHIEYCKSGQAHLHGYVTIAYHPNAIKYDDEHFLKDLAKFFYKLLPKVYYKQFALMSYDAHLRRLKAPAVCINMKNCIHLNWETYINKNACKI